MIVAYNEKLVDRLREALAHLPKVEEKKMFKGVAFMVNDKMCVNVSGDDLMCRFDPALQETLFEKNGFRTMLMKGRELKGYGYVGPEGIKSKKDFDFWVNLCLEFNSKAKSSKKPVKKVAKKTIAKKRK
jgi:TfoX/Sxy family transcriptional regulator of competence genes